jgi:hypothetical protein
VERVSPLIFHQEGWVVNEEDSPVGKPAMSPIHCQSVYSSEPRHMVAKANRKAVFLDSTGKVRFLQPLKGGCSREVMTKLKSQGWAKTLLGVS